MMKKRGQITLFIITGVLVIAAIIIFFLIFSNKLPAIIKPSEQNVNGFLSACLGNKIRDNINALSIQGGSLNSTANVSFKFSNGADPSTIDYLCYNAGYYAPCINQQPLLFPYFENNLKQLSDNDVKNCFNQLVSSMESQGQITSSSYQDTEYTLYDNKLIINIGAEVTATKTASQEFRNFTVLIPTDIGGILRVSQDVINYVATKCDFYYLWAQSYPNFNITKDYDLKDSAVIYSIQDKATSEEFRFATRGCVIPSI